MASWMGDTLQSVPPPTPHPTPPAPNAHVHTYTCALSASLHASLPENQQLEEMLSRADAQAAGGTGEISRLEDELAKAQAARISAEAATAQALAAKSAGGW